MASSSSRKVEVTHLSWVSDFLWKKFSFQTNTSLKAFKLNYDMWHKKLAMVIELSRVFLQRTCFLVMSHDSVISSSLAYNKKQWSPGVSRLFHKQDTSTVVGSGEVFSASLWWVDEVKEICFLTVIWRQKISEPHSIVLLVYELWIII